MSRTVAELRSSAFWRGFAVCLCVNSLHQDALGMERYLAHAREGWIDARFSIPLAAFGLALCALSALSDRKGWL